MFAATIMSGIAATFGTTVGQLFPDIDGFLLSQDFLSVLATAISSLLLALINAIFFGGTAT